MSSKLVLIVTIICLVGCQPKTLSLDYFGQDKPKTEPMVFAKDIVSMANRLEHGISFTPDGQELAFGVLNKTDFRGQVYYSKKVNNSWREPALLEALKTESVFLPYFSPDGKYLLYAQSQPDKNTGFTDIFKLSRENGNWTHTEKLPSCVNSSDRQASACMSLDGDLYFSTNRIGLADIYRSPLEDGIYKQAESMSSINTERDEESIFISPDETYMLFSRYASRQTGPDLYITYRDCFGNWTYAKPIDTSINSSDWERRPFVSMDKKYLFFTRLFFEKNALIESDIYWVNTKKMFKPFVYNSIPDMTIKLGEEKEILIPANYFKDINDEQLRLELKQTDQDWIQFDKENRILKISAKRVGTFDLTFVATDDASNRTENRVKITVTSNNANHVNL